MERQGPPIGPNQTELAEQRAPEHEPAPLRPPHCTLRDLARDYALFTPALIVVAGFDRDPVLEFNRLHPTQNENELPFAIDRDSGRFFDGLGMAVIGLEVIDWNTRLYGIVRERWESLRDTIGSMSFHNPATGVFARVCYHQLAIWDPYLAANEPARTEPPMVEITAFAVSTNRAFIYLSPAEKPPVSRPFPCSEPPHADVVELAKELLPQLGAARNPRGRT